MTECHGEVILFLGQLAWAQQLGSITLVRMEMEKWRDACRLVLFEFLGAWVKYVALYCSCGDN